MVLVSSLVMVACKKETVEIPPLAVKTTSELVVPKDFTWETSRNINFVIGISNTNFQNMPHAVCIYDGDPATTGKLLSKGAATTIAPFRSKIYLPNLLTAVYVVGLFPDGTKITQKVPVGIENINIAIGI